MLGAMREKYFLSQILINPKWESIDIKDKQMCCENHLG